MGLTSVCFLKREEPNKVKGYPAEPDTEWNSHKENYTVSSDHCLDVYM